MSGTTGTDFKTMKDVEVMSVSLVYYNAAVDEIYVFEGTMSGMIGIYVGLKAFKFWTFLGVL